MLWFGLSSAAIIFVVVFGAIWPISANTDTGFRTIGATTRMVALNLGLSRSQTVRDVFFQPHFRISYLACVWPGPLAGAPSLVPKSSLAWLAPMVGLAGISTMRATSSIPQPSLPAWSLFRCWAFCWITFPVDRAENSCEMGHEASPVGAQTYQASVPLREHFSCPYHLQEKEHHCE